MEYKKASTTEIKRINPIGSRNPTRKDKHIRIRITEEQLTRLIQRLDQENKRKSTLLRELIDLYLNRTCREDWADK